jgi:serine/threonine protein kinase
MLTGELPFKYKDSLMYFKKVPNPDEPIPELPDRISEPLKSICRRLMVRDPAQRLSSSDLF